MVKINHTEIPCIFDDRDKGWGEKTTDFCPTQRATRNGIKAIVKGGKKMNEENKAKYKYKDGVLFVNPEMLENSDEQSNEQSSDLEIDNLEIDNGYRIRKLTPKECWRLMGFSDEDFEKAQNAGVSNTQLYKQAGNSIVTNVLYYIFKELYAAMPYLFKGLKVSSYFSGIGAFEIALNKLFEDINSENFMIPQMTCSTNVE